MRLLWNRSFKNLRQILDLKEPVSVAGLEARLRLCYGDFISNSILDRSLGIDQILFFNHTLGELTGLLFDRRAEWDRLKGADMTVLIEDLLSAVQWKMQIKGYIYSGERTAVLARQGLGVLPGLKDSLHNFGRDATGSLRRRLYQTYMLTDNDIEQVTQRALRCVVTYYRHRIPEDIFAWNESFELTLKGDILDTYLFEQLSLFTHFFRGEKGEVLLATARQELANHFRKFIYGPERAEYVNDIVQETFKVFYEEFALKKEHFFVDARLKYFLRRLERNRKILNNYLRQDDLDEKIRLLEQAAEVEQESEFPSELIDIVRACLNKLSQECQKVIRTRKFGDYADTISVSDLSTLLQMDFQVLRSVVRRCDNDMESCVITQSALLGFRPF